MSTIDACLLIVAVGALGMGGFAQLGDSTRLAISGDSQGAASTMANPEQSSDNGASSSEQGRSSSAPAVSSHAAAAVGSWLARTAGRFYLGASEASAELADAAYGFIKRIPEGQSLPPAPRAALDNLLDNHAGDMVRVFAEARSSDEAVRQMSRIADLRDPASQAYTAMLFYLERLRGSEALKKGLQKKAGFEFENEVIHAYDRIASGDNTAIYDLGLAHHHAETVGQKAFLDAAALFASVTISANGRANPVTLRAARDLFDRRLASLGPQEPRADQINLGDWLAPQGPSSGDVNLGDWLAPQGPNAERINLDEWLAPQGPRARARLFETVGRFYLGASEASVELADAAYGFLKRVPDGQSLPPAAPAVLDNLLKKHADDMVRVFAAANSSDDAVRQMSRIADLRDPASQTYTAMLFYLERLRGSDALKNGLQEEAGFEDEVIRAYKRIASGDNTALYDLGLAHHHAKTAGDKAFLDAANLLATVTISPNGRANPVKLRAARDIFRRPVASQEPRADRINLGDWLAPQDS